MITTVTVTPNVPAFASALYRYANLTSKTPDEVLEKKGRDIGIKFYNGFSAKKWGGSGAPRKGLAAMELDRRTQSGRGTLVRASLKKQYLAERSALRSEQDSFIGPRNQRQELKRIKSRVSLWQKFVGKETRIRQSGIGVLAASFLWYRKRSSQAKGTYTVKNRSGRPLGTHEVKDGVMTIRSTVGGIVDVDQRYGITQSALTVVAEDMDSYSLRKMSENFHAAFRGAS